jgi:uncharacterized protein (UPF0332 family)
VGSKISPELSRLLSERKLICAQISADMILKEIAAVESDLKDARDSMQNDKFKWATIQAYYSMFHSARALLFSKGYREKSHFALLLALRELFSKELERSLMGRFEDGMNLRQEADYGSKFSEAGAIDTIDGAEELLKKTNEILKDNLKTR